MLRRVHEEKIFLKNQRKKKKKILDNVWAPSKILVSSFHNHIFVSFIQSMKAIFAQQRTGKIFFSLLSK